MGTARAAGLLLPKMAPSGAWMGADRMLPVILPLHACRETCVSPKLCRPALAKKSFRRSQLTSSLTRLGMILYRTGKGLVY